MMNATVLRRAEGIRMDADRLVELYATLGETAANAVIGLAVDQMLSFRGLVSAPPGSRRLPDCRSVEALSRMAERIGMSSVASVARDLTDAMRGGDATARAAICARLVRVCDQSLSELSELQRAIS